MRQQKLNQPPVDSDAFSVVANLGGPELLDRLYGSLASEDPVEFALFSGAMRSTESTRHGDMVESVGEFRPGIDQSTQINVPATLAAERPQANRIRTDVDIPRLVIAADLPERLNNTSGKLTERVLGRYAVAMGLVLASRARGLATLTLSDEQGAETVFEDMASESYLAMEAVDQMSDLERSENISPLARSLELIEEELVEQKDVALVVGDFMGGYDANTDTFDWEGRLSRIAGSLGDRLLAVQLRSQAQMELPTAVTGLPLDRIQAVRQAYMGRAEQKASRLASIFQHIRTTEVRADDSTVHPVVQINDFLVGEDL